MKLKAGAQMAPPTKPSAFGLPTSPLSSQAAPSSSTNLQHTGLPRASHHQRLLCLGLGTAARAALSGTLSTLFCPAPLNTPKAQATDDVDMVPGSGISPAPAELSLGTHDTPNYFLSVNPPQQISRRAGNKSISFPATVALPGEEPLTFVKEN